ncbi:MAG: type 2 isopentenyl-diphosphate Delta-isomerase [Tissierellia bacterium]|nr:type 2 isopentenyl-diphosphate Delta-isomerase [Tissierellia bacterium]
MNKKDDHVNLALEFYKDTKISDFDNIDFVHKVLPELNIEDVDISTSFCGFDFSQPFHINGMTGGTEKTKEFNRKIAILARETDTFMAAGSLSVALKDESVVDSFKVIREENKSGIVFANLGADKTLEDAKRAIDILDADGIQIHINVCQEIVMPEGERNFEGWLSNISEIVEKLGKPVLVKEVGFGMDRSAIKKLRKICVNTIDISGKGGTNFARIENFRREKFKYNFLENFGNSTVVSMLEAQNYICSNEIIASGGIRNSMDIVKSLALGAKSVGMAAGILNLVNENSIEDAIDTVNHWKYEIKAIMTLLGAKNIGDLLKTDLIFRKDVKDWCKTRNIDYKSFGNRSKIC